MTRAYSCTERRPTRPRPRRIRPGRARGGGERRPRVRRRAGGPLGGQRLLPLPAGFADRSLVALPAAAGLAAVVRRLARLRRLPALVPVRRACRRCCRSLVPRPWSCRRRWSAAAAVGRRRPAVRLAARRSGRLSLACARRAEPSPAFRRRTNGGGLAGRPAPAAGDSSTAVLDSPALACSHSLIEPPVGAGPRPHRAGPPRRSLGRGGRSRRWLARARDRRRRRPDRTRCRSGRRRTGLAQRPTCGSDSPPSAAARPVDGVPTGRAAIGPGRRRLGDARRRRRCAAGPSSCPSPGCRFVSCPPDRAAGRCRRPGPRRRPASPRSTGAPAARTTATTNSGSILPLPRLSCRSRPESKASLESLAWIRSIRPVIALTRSTMSSRSSPPACAWQVSRQKPTPNSPTASHSRARASNRRAQALSPPAVFSISTGRGRPPSFSAYCEGLAPVVEADGQVVARADVAAVHDQPLRAQLGGGLGVRQQQLAAGDPDPVVERGDVDDVRRVDVDVHVGRLERRRVGTRLGRFIALRVGEEELDRVRLAGGRRGEGSAGSTWAPMRMQRAYDAGTTIPRASPGPPGISLSPLITLTGWPGPRPERGDHRMSRQVRHRVTAVAAGRAPARRRRCWRRTADAGEPGRGRARTGGHRHSVGVTDADRPISAIPVGRPTVRDPDSGSAAYQISQAKSRSDGVRAAAHRSLAGMSPRLPGRRARGRRTHTGSSVPDGRRRPPHRPARRRHRGGAGGATEPMPAIGLDRPARRGVHGVGPRRIRRRDSGNCVATCISDKDRVS